MSDVSESFPVLTSSNKHTLDINELTIKKLVNSFYNKVRKDTMLGPIFNEKIGNNWDMHLSIMYNFWSSIALGTARYKGQPMAKHINLPILNETHFNHWLTIFEENAYEVCSKDVAEFFITKARKIAESLLLGINFHHNKLNLLKGAI